MRLQFSMAIEISKPALMRRPRMASWLAVLAVGLLAPAAVVASHQFTDVPTSNTFHADISKVASAGVTSGCGTGKYCPNDAVTRAQMAAFLDRGLGRIARENVGVQGQGLDEFLVGSVDLVPGTSSGGIAGAGQFVHATFDGQVVFDTVHDCPCTLAVMLRRDGVDLQGVPIQATVTSAGSHIPLSAAAAVRVTGSGPITVDLVAFIQPWSGGDGVTGYNINGTLLATTVPLGWNGGTTLE